MRVIGQRRTAFLAVSTAALAAFAGVSHGQEIARVTRGPYLQLATPNSITVRWRTDVPTDSQVRYGTDLATLDRLATVATPATEHEVLIEGLAPGTRYYYAVGSLAGDVSSGPDHTFVTPPVAGTSQPVRIWTFGDSGWGQVQGEGPRVRDAYRQFTGERGTDVWLLLGDNAYASIDLQPWITRGGYASETVAVGGEDGRGRQRDHQQEPLGGHQRAGQ